MWNPISSLKRLSHAKESALESDTDVEFAPLGLIEETTMKMWGDGGRMDVAKQSFDGDVGRDRFYQLMYRERRQYCGEWMALIGRDQGPIPVEKISG